MSIHSLHLTVRLKVEMPAAAIDIIFFVLKLDIQPQFHKKFGHYVKRQ